MGGWIEGIRLTPEYRKFRLFSSIHGMALFQLIVVTLLSNAPVLLSALIKMLIEGPHEASKLAVYATNLIDLLKGGNVYIYSAAMIAPFWWTLLEAQRNNERIPHFWMPLSVGIVSLLLGTILFSLSQSAAIHDNDLANGIAIFVYIGSLIVLYWSIYSDRRKGPVVNQFHEREEIAVDSIVRDLEKGANP
jgi:hypothetical protein